jgi:hypothetical protein
VRMVARPQDNFKRCILDFGPAFRDVSPRMIHPGNFRVASVDFEIAREIVGTSGVSQNLFRNRFETAITFSSCVHELNVLDETVHCIGRAGLVYRYEHWRRCTLQDGFCSSHPCTTGCVSAAQFSDFFAAETIYQT